MATPPRPRRHVRATSPIPVLCGRRHRASLQKSPFSKCLGDARTAPAFLRRGVFASVRESDPKTAARRSPDCGGFLLGFKAKFQPNRPTWLVCGVCPLFFPQLRFLQVIHLVGSDNPYSPRNPSPKKNKAKHYPFLKGERERERKGGREGADPRQVTCE